MRIVVIGGSGHIGTFLIPRLVRAGHEVVNISRGNRTAYIESPEWHQVRQVTADRQREDAAGEFANRVARLRPDVVVDLVCFTVESAAALVETLRGQAGHLLHCGSTWRYGPSRTLPISEDGTGAEPPFGEYGVAKSAIARMLKAETASGGLACTSLHPGHIVGPGWPPVGPLGNFDPAVWRALSSGAVLKVPGDGTAMMHHVHADDVAQAFERAVVRRDAAAGEDFTVVAPTALSVRGYAGIAAEWFGRTASLESVTWEQFRQDTSTSDAETSWNHLYRSQCFSIGKAVERLGYAPRYGSDQAVLESVRWLVENGRLELDGRLLA